MNRNTPAVLLIAAALLTAAATARAAVVVNALQVGGDVVFTGGGTVNLAAIGLVDNTYETQGKITPQNNEALLGADPADDVGADIYGFFQISGPGFFGFGSETVADSGTGDRFGISDNLAASLGLFVPRGYVSGSALAGTLTFENTDFATLGLTPGTYAYTWGSGGNADSFTLNILVPEPASAAALAASGVVLCFRARRDT